MRRFHRRNFNRYSGGSHDENHKRKLALMFRSDSRAYVRDRFFNLTDSQFKDFIKFYASKYGISPRDYLLNTYYSWKSGSTKMSQQTETRLLSCVPKVLFQDEQVVLLRYNLEYFIEHENHRFNFKQIPLSNLAAAYYEHLVYLEKRDITLDWFIKDIFSADEMGHFISLFRYLLIKRLEISFLAVCNDLQRIKQLVNQTSAPVSVSYKIKFFNIEINFDSYSVPNRNSFTVSEEIPDFFKSQSNLLKEFLSQDALEMQKDHTQSTIKALISSNDIKLALDQIASFSQEVDCKMNANGEGGLINLHFVRKDLKRLNYELQKKGWLLASYTFLASSIYLHGIKNGYISFLLFPVGIFTIIVFASLYTSLTNTKKEIKEYERKQTVRFN